MEDLENTVYGLSREDRVLDVIILIDGSGSINSTDWDIIKFSARHLLSRVNLKSSRVALVQFSKYGRIEHEFSNDSYSLQLTLNNLCQMREHTNTKVGLELCGDMFTSSSANAERIIILLTDGDASDKPEDKALELQSQLGVKIIGIGIGSHVSRVRLEQVATLNYCFLIPSMEALRSIFTKIGTYAYEKPEVKVLRRFCNKLEIEIACSEVIAEFKVEIFDTSADSEDKYKLFESIVVPNPSQALVKTFITGLKSFSAVDFRVYGIMKNNRKQTATVYVKERTLDEKRDSSLLKDPALLVEEINKLLDRIKAWQPDTFLQEHIGLLEARIALLGRVGEGKSSFINTVLSRFNGEYKNVAVAMAHTKSVTSALTLYPLKGSNILLMDSYGWEDGNYSEDEQRLICDGVLSEGYVEGEGPASYLLRKKKAETPSFGEAVHGVVIVCDADAVTNKTFMTRLKHFEVTWKKFKRSLVVLMTKCDNADSELIDHPESIYDSEIVEKRITTLSKLTGIDKGDIYPCVNRTGLNVTNPDVREYLALKALSSCVFSAVTGTLDAEERKLVLEEKERDREEKKRILEDKRKSLLLNSNLSTSVNNAEVSSPSTPEKPKSTLQDPSPSSNPASPLPFAPTEELILMIALQDGSYIELPVIERTMKGLKEAIVSVEEFGLKDVGSISQVSVRKEIDGATKEVLMRNDRDIARLRENQVVCFKTK